MNLPAHLNLQQRYDRTIFLSIALATFLLMGMMYQAITKYTNDYTNHYWQGYTNTFSNSVKFQTVLGSISGAEDIARNFASDKNVLKASIYNNQNVLLAFTGDNLDCKTTQTDFKNTFFSETDNFWCFYSPIYKVDYLGHVEMAISKAELKAVMRKLLFASGIIILAFSVIIFLLIRHFSGLFTKTLVDISVVLKKVRQGQRGGRVSFSGSADINKMRDDFNDVLTKIELNERTLEQRVADRTSALRIALDNSQSANRYKHQIMAMITHEMKTPLHAVIGYTETVLDELPMDENFDVKRKFLDRALIRANDLKEMIEKILLQGKLEADKFELNYSKIAIKPLLQECLKKMALLQKKNRNRLILLGKEITIVSDIEAIRHILNNLLNNACKFTVDGDITIAWWLDTPSVLVIQVSDTGCGISIECRNQIFDPFWQEDMSLSRKYGGHGLGLAITQQFIQRLQGEITVDSNKGGIGTTFTIRIPNLID